MKNEDREKYTEIMLGLCEIFTPDKEVNEVKLKLYFKHFQHWTLEQFTTACENLLSTKKIANTFPLPAEIEEALIPDDAVLSKWNILMAAAETHGSQFSITFSDHVIHSVINTMGGWSHLCQLPKGKPRFFAQREFERLYRQFNMKETHPNHVTGTHDLIENFISVFQGYSDGCFRSERLNPVVTKYFIENECLKLSDIPMEVTDNSGYLGYSNFKDRKQIENKG